MQQLGQISTPPPPPGSLSRRRKAAMIVQLLFRDGNGIPLNRMPPKLQEALAHEMGAIRLVDRETVNTVAEEFVAELEAVGLVAEGDTLKALDALGDNIDQDLAERIRTEVVAHRKGDPWPLIAALPEIDLVDVLNQQSLQVGGIVLSKIDVAKAASVLGKLDGARARRITFGMSQTKDVSPDAVLRIGKALVEDHCRKPAIAFHHGPDSRLGDILNSSPATTRDDVLVGLTEADEVFADDVRKKIFTFADIAVRLKPNDVAICLRNLDNDALETALAAALRGDDGEKNGAEFILSNISQRMADQLRETAEDLGAVSRETGEKAMNAVTTVIREMANDGLISYREPEADGTS
ncbi:MAG: FliG C-terminal domain-containing protein [Pseudomonadota bacterium]